MFRRRLFSTATAAPFPVHRFAPHATLEHPLHGSTAKDALQPSIIVIQEWWGVNDQIKAHAQRIANNTGATAIVPDIYYGKTTLDAEEAKHMMDGLDWAKALKDLESLAMTEGASRKRKVGTVGFCMGGALSLALAARMVKNSNPLNACVSFYGIPPKQLIDVSSIPIKTPVQAHFGELDDFVGFSDIGAAKKLAEEWGIAVKQAGGIHSKGFHSLESNVFIHPKVGHAFMNEVQKREYFNKEDVDKTWSQVFAFFIEHLKTV